MKNYDDTQLKLIREQLKRGDITIIAQRANVCRVWASNVINGKGTSNPILQEAERLIAERARKLEPNNIEAAGLFQIGSNVYRAISNAGGLSCRDCVAVEAHNICWKLPECHALIFEILSARELKQAKQNKIHIERL